jgi:hypothetical protein
MGHTGTILIAAAVFAAWTAGAGAQESAFEFNRQEWLRRSGAAPAAGARPSQAAAPAPVRHAAPQAYAPPVDFFSALFGPRSVPNDGRPSITITPGGRWGEGHGEGLGEEPARGGVGSYAFCVRTCDGRYFPLQGRPGAGNAAAALTQCSSFCPAAKMDVYYTYASDKAIDGAVNANGKPYTSLATAFVYRERLVPDCNCTGDGRAGGMHYVDITEDPTLRRGDIVMTASGAKVFAGGAKAKPPYRERDFVAPERFPGLPASMRKRIAELTKW